VKGAEGRGEVMSVMERVRMSRGTTLPNVSVRAERQSVRASETTTADARMGQRRCTIAFRLQTELLGGQSWSTQTTANSTYP
jgi:hypothetical protein